MPQKIIVTSALPYANGPIHFGHVVGAYLPADIYVRFRRMRGDDVHFVCGTDEHGVAITLRAEQEGTPFEAYVDRWHGVIGATLEHLGIGFDVFSGTSHHRNPEHRALAQQFFLDLRANGYLLERTEEQYFSETQGRFLPDRYIEGTCYLCGFEKARGDECPSCGKYLDAKKLLAPRSTIDGSSPVLRESTHWYLDLARARDEWLREWFEQKHGQWKPNVENFVLADLAELRERPITRDLPWGVPVPLPDSDGKVLYVWFDAPIGYLSISKQYWIERGQPERFEELWKGADTELYHFIGKDNITFHAVVFPAILKGADRGWILPQNVPANEFFNLEGRKFNTSAGWFIPASSVADLSVDALRYALCTMMPETADSDWTWQEFQARVNSDLADNLGNFVSRTLRFVERFFGGTIPGVAEHLAADRELISAAREASAEMQEHLSNFRFRRACQSITALGNTCNRYYDTAAPWTSVKTDAGRPRAAHVIRMCCEMVRSLAIMMHPLMPTSSATILGALGLGGRPPRFTDIGDVPAPDSGFGSGESGAGPIAGATLTSGLPKFTDAKGQEKTALFQKFSDERVAEEVARLQRSALATTQTAPAVPTAGPAESREDQSAPPAAERSFEPLAATIEFSTFEAVDLRAGTIVKAERHPKADRLLVLEVDLGFEVRQIVAGVAGSYDPAELPGVRVVAVVNLAPRKLRGIESNGMLLATEDTAGKARFVAPGRDAADGTRVH